MSEISIHAVDVARGEPARGMRVRVYRTAPRRELIADDRIGENGSFPAVIGDLAAGSYEAVFSVGAFYRSAGADSGFLDEVPFAFVVAEGSEHYHLPFKFTPWGFSLFRGR